MPDLTAKRTLVKSPPELWEELSEVEGLAKHLGAFGEIKITKLEPEHTVAWEGEHASGTVSIEPSGWGTKVTLHAELPEEEGPEPEEPPTEEPADDPPAAGAEQPIAEEPIAVEEPSVDEPIAVEEPSVDEPIAVEEPSVEEAAVEEPIAEKPAVEVPSSATEERVAEEPEPVAEDAQPGRTRRGFWGWLFRTRTGGPPVEEPEPVEPEPVAVEPEPEPVAVEPEPEPEPVAVEPVAVEPEPEPIEPADEGSDPMNGPVAEEGDDRGGLTPAAEEAEPEPEPAEPADPAVDPERARAILDEALDALGAAHHRPFSRG
jgi:hypothetical protein